ncbi:MAG: glycosyltransferase family 4 protein [Chloroflexi bacterium]|nr:glycosyltransferase family 4 protein [Chloroflexota bacterium]
MKIAFLSTRSSLDPFRIGGSNNYARRVANEVQASHGHCSFYLYGAPQKERRLLPSGVTVDYLRDLRAALHQIAEARPDIVISWQFYSRDNLVFLRFRRAFHRRIRFVHVYLSHTPNWIKRGLKYWLNRPYCHKTVAISPRLQRSLRRHGVASELVLPPVPREYFLDPSSKRMDPPYTVTYLGRVDSDRGVDRLISALQWDDLTNSGSFRVKVYGLNNPLSPGADKLLGYLRSCDGIEYREATYEAGQSDPDTGALSAFRETDILLLPFRDLSQTVDTPLTLLEGMASLCIPVFGDVPNMTQINGCSKFSLKQGSIASALGGIELADLVAERKRLAARSSELAFDTQSVVQRLLA